MRRSTSMLMRLWPKPRPVLAPGWNFTTRNASTRASAIAHRGKFTRKACGYVDDRRCRPRGRRSIGPNSADASKPLPIWRGAEKFEFIPLQQRVACEPYFGEKHCIDDCQYFAEARRPTTVPAMAALLAERKVQRRDASPYLPRQSDRRTPGAAGCGLRSRVAHPPRPCPPRQAPVGDVTLLRNEKQTARLAE